MSITSVSSSQKCEGTRKVESSFLAKISANIVEMMVLYLPHREMFRLSTIDRSIFQWYQKDNKIRQLFQHRLRSYRANSYLAFADSLRFDLSANIRHLTIRPSLSELIPEEALKMALINCSNLQLLDLSWVDQVTRSSLVHLPHSLRAINFANSGIPGADLVVLKNLPSLEFVDLSYCKNISGAVLAHFPLSIKALILEGCNITDAELSLLARFPLLESLDLTNCREITGEGLSKLPKTITSLTINMKDLTDEDLASLSHLTSLGSISLQANWSLKGSGLAHLPNSVQSIVLDCSFFIKDLSRLPPKLQILSLQMCNLADPILLSIDTSSLKALNLSENPKISKKGLSTIPKTVKLRNEEKMDRFAYPWFQYNRSRA